MANSKPKKRKKILIFSLIGLAVLGLTLFAVFRKREVVVVVQTEKVNRRNLTEVVVANGRVQPVTQAVINPEVSGEIIELPVKEGQRVNKGDLLLRIRPDKYVAGRNLAQASYLSSIAAITQSQAGLTRAESEYVRAKGLFENKLISDSDYVLAKTDYDRAKAVCESSSQNTEQAKAQLAQAEEDLAKTTIVAPIAGTVTRLRSQLGERVVGTAMMAGTEIMTIANLEEMEARVDIGEIDIVLIALGQNARLEVDSFRDKKFTGTVSEIANASKGSTAQSSGTSQEATKFEVKIRIKEKGVFRPGMSVTSEIETRSRTNVLCVPIQSVTTRLPKPPVDSKKDPKKDADKKSDTAENKPKETNADVHPIGKKKDEAPKPSEVVFLLENGAAKMVTVKPGISDDSYYEITEGLSEGQEVVSGGYKAISRELEDGKKIKVGPAKGTDAKEEKKP